MSSVRFSRRLLGVAPETEGEGRARKAPLPRPFPKILEGTAPSHRVERRRSLSLRAAGTVLLLALPCGAAPVDPYDRAAGEILSAVARLGRRSVAVTPFYSVSGNESLAGAVISERLVARLQRGRGIDVVERSLLKTVWRERAIDAGGRVAASEAPETRRGMGGVDALVTGTVHELKDGRVEVNVRLLDPKTARVLVCAPMRVERDWSLVADDVLTPDLTAPPVPSLISVPSAPVFGLTRGFLGMDCGQARDKTERLEELLVDVKARYWALRLKDREFKVQKLRRNPGTEISDPEVKNLFYSRLRHWFQEDYVPHLSRQEFESYTRLEKMRDHLTSACGA